jgi:phage major head subunit gpT-like protein
MLTHGDVMLRDTARAAFWGAFNDTPDMMTWLGMRRTSTSDQETYAGFAFAPGVREMIGGRTKRSVPQYSFTVVNKEFESTVAIDYKTRKFNKNNDVANLLSAMGMKARAYPTKLGASILDTNTAAAGYDNLALFHASHVDPGAPYTTVQSNALTANWTTDGVPTDIELSTAIRLSMGALRTYKDGDGDPFWPGDTFDCVVMVPPQLYDMANRVQTVDLLTGSVGNDLKGRFRTAVNPYLPYVTTACNFYVVNASSQYRPLVYQVAEDVSLTDDLGGDNAYDTKTVSFGTYAMYNEGPGYWRSFVRFQGT